MASFGLSERKKKGIVIKIKHVGKPTIFCCCFLSLFFSNTVQRMTKKKNQTKKKTHTSRECVADPFDPPRLSSTIRMKQQTPRTPMCSVEVPCAHCTRPVIRYDFSYLEATT